MPSLTTELEDAFRELPYNGMGDLDCAGAVVNPVSHSAPVDIPVELLAYIFTLTLPAKIGTYSAVPVLSKRTPHKPWILGGSWALGQVCGLWRAVALSSPTLWTSFTLSTRLWERELPLLNMQLERSRTAPLDVCLTFVKSTTELPFKTFLSNLISHCGRLRKVHIEGDPSPTTVTLWSLGQMPILTDVVWNKVRPSEIRHLLNRAANISRLTILVAGSRTVLPPLMAKVQSYKARYTTWSILSKEVSAAVSLAERDILGWGRMDGSLTLPHLRRLAVHGRLLGHFVAPALQEICVTGLIDFVPPFLQRSGCVLTRLMLFNFAGTGPELISLLRSSPSVATLEIDFLSGLFPAFTALISALTIVAGTDVDNLCPCLVSLSLGDRVDRMDYPAFVAIVDMLRSRWRTPGRESPSLKRARIYLGDIRMKTSGRWRQWMQILVNEGMDVAVVESTRRDYPSMNSWRDNWTVI
ncbi:hypothetical protein MSAN_02001200 [Mycena sanguinolenta]|uniref:F-box domain-containing protein n=1 Tax=Mycena sanguinolenta TaxID=230812 RepID=A0A8H7CNU2_9AGAR|nr:hypothetical protein MSAN_02001200 [Mycena sanguinolenta]